MRTTNLGALFLLLAATPCVRAADWLVDATGARSQHTTIGQVMTLAAPGDRILVLPGDYPAFQYERGVQIFGLGQHPEDVRIARVDFHVSIPSIGYETLLSNVQLGDGSATNALALTGNELPPGTLVIDGSFIFGGVFLGGGANGFYVHMSNSRVQPPPGFGFLGTAMHLGGTPGFAFDIVDSIVTGWDANPGLGMTSGVALKLAGAARGRIVRSTIQGGDGSAAGGSFGPGADAISHFGTAAAVTLRLDGQATVHGGDSPVAAAGDGVDLAGTLELGTATVQGGEGMPDGEAWPLASPVALPTPACMLVSPVLIGAQTASFISSGGGVQVSVPDAQPAQCALIFSLHLSPPGATLAVLGAPLAIVIGNDLSLGIPFLAGGNTPGVMLYAQGYVRPAGGGKLVLTNPICRRIDLTTPGGP